MKRAAFVALAFGLLTSTAQAEPVKLADKEMARFAAGTLVEIPSINTNIATGVQNTFVITPLTAVAVSAFGGTSSAGNIEGVLAGNIGISAAGFFPTP
jgi:hypothetical protein